MIRSALKVYKKNIFDVFAAVGILTVGILIGALVITPVIINAVNNATNRILASASSVATSGFDASAFLDSVVDQFKTMDWSNPIRTLQTLVDRNGFYRLFMNALKDANFNEEVLEDMKYAVLQNCDALINCIKEELIFFAICVVVAAGIAVFACRLVAQIRSTERRGILRFLLAFILNLATAVGAYAGIVAVLLTAQGDNVVFSVLGILAALLLLTMIWSCLCYCRKGVKFFDLFNFKTIGLLFLSTFVVLAISAIIFGVLYAISDVVALVVLIPLVIVNNIIIENIVINYASGYEPKAKTPAAKTEKN